MILVEQIMPSCWCLLHELGFESQQNTTLRTNTHTHHSTLLCENPSSMSTMMYKIRFPYKELQTGNQFIIGKVKNRGFPQGILKLKNWEELQVVSRSICEVENYLTMRNQVSLAIRNSEAEKSGLLIYTCKELGIVKLKNQVYKKLRHQVSL